ncbi:UNVERIFIED_CONTAM: hypothetical protein Sangu_2470300 [Sesamum angustifolium]|uniref:Reverse transcriptase zinc-binding domain-containing protein n=1 Tax=Sesamum angustifolium TaxID=2727405 RepID=A0AAW2IWW8_9LAMI
MEGRWAWRFHKIGCFIVKSAYRQVVAIRETTEPSTPNEGMSLGDGAGSLWSILWKSRVPPKVKVFMRRLCTESLPKLERLARRNKYIDTCCGVCRTTVESSRYVMFECTVARQMWALALLLWRFVSNWSGSIGGSSPMGRFGSVFLCFVGQYGECDARDIWKGSIWISRMCGDNLSSH